jgi:hypothetical protein
LGGEIAPDPSRADDPDLHASALLPDALEVMTGMICALKSSVAGTAQ